MDFFSTSKFRKVYAQLASELCEAYAIPRGKFIIQSQPTPRIFKPESHGTSWHTDYWYGHGKEFFTAWVPLQGVVAGATFETLQSLEHNNKLLNHYTNSPELLQKDFDLLGYEPSIVLPAKEQIAVFGSTVLHASLKNKTKTTRISFDFRFGPSGDITSTKDYNNYLALDVHGDLRSRVSKHKSFLKYIRGGKNVSTSSQHILLEACCEANQVEIIAQEAEIERYGQPMFIKHVKEIMRGESKFAGIAVGCKALIDPENMDLVKQTRVPIYFALENTFLTQSDSSTYAGSRTKI
ncbi:hypothetical protein [Parvularcula sp. IMCC14364]|uniref:hypothetical protein n=1 Tax=Parvularcula sp. IMCC14364 TaxID=3067902 RepID=UPI002740A28D|nr:hypothetical protein [Parvularcula sp. IMCC14364]